MYDDVCEYERNDQCYGYSALPATNMTPENMTSQNESSLPTQP